LIAATLLGHFACEVAGVIRAWLSNMQGSYEGHIWVDLFVEDCWSIYEGHGGLERLERGLISVRKTGPWSNKIKQMKKQNTEDTQYKRDTDLRGSPSVGYVHQRNCQVLPLFLSSK